MPDMSINHSVEAVTYIEDELAARPRESVAIVFWSDPYGASHPRVAALSDTKGEMETFAAIAHDLARATCESVAVVTFTDAGPDVVRRISGRVAELAALLGEVEHYHWCDHVVTTVAADGSETYPVAVRPRWLPHYPVS
jgi:hypothetical protein